MRELSALTCRLATSADVPAMAECRLRDPAAGAADPRMAAYLEGHHHPQLALPPRVAFAAFAGPLLVGYIAGHLSTRHGCDGEVQYLFVDPAHRRAGVATELLLKLSQWFASRQAKRVCVCLDGDSPSARPFYTATGASQLSPQRPLWFVWEDMEAAVTRLASPNPEA